MKHNLERKALMIVALLTAAMILTLINDVRREMKPKYYYHDGRGNLTEIVKE